MGSYQAALGTLLFQLQLLAVFQGELHDGSLQGTGDQELPQQTSQSSPPAGEGSGSYQPREQGTPSPREKEGREQDSL